MFRTLFWVYQVTSMNWSDTAYENDNVISLNFTIYMFTFMNLTFYIFTFM